MGTLNQSLRMLESNRRWHAYFGTPESLKEAEKMYNDAYEEYESALAEENEAQYEEQPIVEAPTQKKATAKPKQPKQPIKQLNMF